MTDIKISVVIATLGGNSLSVTIESLLNGSKIPNEILICIPVDFVSNVSSLATDVVKIIATEVKGQVKQRAFGFSQTRFPVVLQLDDDILLEKDTLKEMTAQLIYLGKGNVLAPVYYGQHSGLCIHALQNGFAKNVFDYFICAAPWGVNKMGIVSKIGLNYGVDDTYCTEILKRSEWLPGGCVLSFKEDLVLQDFFPFTGKAYCEDIYHSYFRKLAGTKLWVATRIKVFIEEPEPEFSWAATEKVISIRRYFIKLINGPQWRLSIYEAFCRMRSKRYAKKQPINNDGRNDRLYSGNTGL